MKFFTSEGKKLPNETELEIEKLLTQDLKVVSSDSLGKVSRITDAAGRYIEFCKSTIPTKIKLNGLKVVVDCAHGATYHIAPNVFSELGAEVLSIASQPNGLNINANCGAVNPTCLLYTSDAADE